MIGVFDSGVGGLSVWREIVRLLPAHDTLYVADQAHVPYGPRPLEQVRAFALSIARFLRDEGAQAIVVACNTASAAALHHLRATLTDVPFVGMEPAVKPAAQNTRTGRVGVIATPATFQGELFAALVERFADGVVVFEQVCPGLVEQIEAGALDAPETRALLEECLAPVLAAGIDELVLGCTHYPLVRPLIEQIVGPAVEVLDPAPAVARQTARVLAERGLTSVGRTGRHVLATTGDPRAFAALVERLVGAQVEVRQVVWRGERLAWGMKSTQSICVKE